MWVEMLVTIVLCGIGLGLLGKLLHWLESDE